MINKITNSILNLRSFITKKIIKKEKYWLASKNLKPISNKFGFDRGKPIDRFWIESFLREDKSLIYGKVLEVGDSRYTKQYGNDIKKSDVLDVDKNNKKANIISDIKSMKQIKDNYYDCIILTHVLGMVDDYNTALLECRRILKKGGTILVTMSSFSPVWSGLEVNYWRFTYASAKLVFGKIFKKVKVKTFGNVLSGQAFWVGLAQEELTIKQLEYNDSNFPCIVGIVAHK